MKKEYSGTEMMMSGLMALLSGNPNAATILISEGFHKQGASIQKDKIEQKNKDSK